jgi:hypothetical protein
VIGGNELAPLAQDLSDGEIKIVLPATLHAGINSVQIVQKLMLGSPPAEHSGFESRVAAFVLSPEIKNIDTSVPGSIIIEPKPPLGASQRAVLLLNKNAPTGTNYTFPAELPPTNPPNVKFPLPVSGLVAGPYFVRVQVDGAESSLLDLNPLSPTFKQFIAPQITI